MARKLPKKDVVIVGLGWTGSIMAHELTDEGLDVIAIERGPWRDAPTEYPPNYAQDEPVEPDLKYSTSRAGLVGACFFRTPNLKTWRIAFHTWEVDEVRQFEERHPVGTKARLALALLLFTGQRRSDVIRFGKQHTKGRKLAFTQFKGRNRKPKKLTLPILPVLKQVIDASPYGDVTFLVNDWNRAFTDAGFGNKFRDWCDQADLRHCSAHGLRKAGATIAANNGASSRQLMAIFGWDTIKQAEHYTRGADQQRLADDAMHLLEVRENV
jgi:integrase